MSVTIFSTLDETAIISWWSQTQLDPLLDHKLTSQCSTPVVRALTIGADRDFRNRVNRWLTMHAACTPVLKPLPLVAGTGVCTTQRH
jgi:hypothetical protein